MEILAHGLWSAAAAVGGERVVKRRISILWSAFWGIFPDVFAFSLIIGWYALKVLTGQDVSDLPGPIDVEPIVADRFWIVQVTSYLYLIGHSAVVFALIFALVCVMQRRVVWSMLGWLLHIGIDLFTHSYAIYPSPFLFPVLLTDFKGIWWAQGWFMVINYLALIFVYWRILKSSSRERLFEVAVSIQSGVRGVMRRIGMWKREKI